MEENYFTHLYGINVNDHVEHKNGLSYLSWAWAWAEVKKFDPDASYEIFERETEYGPVNYFTDGATAWVKTAVTVKGRTHIEELPIMNNRNMSIPYDAITSTDVNKTIQRSLTKAIARHGLGLYLYAGEDLPDGETDENQVDTEEEAKHTKAAKEAAVKAAKEVAVKVDAAVVTPASAKGSGVVKPSVATESDELTATKKEIGKYAKAIKSTRGSLDYYNDIVKSVTGNDSFRCNTAEDKDLPVLKKILETLKSDPALK
jgi:hypothetical protein